jgi:ATP/maltotriose-dependent transcriptional regulator MalT
MMVGMALTWPLTARGSLFERLGRAYVEAERGGVVLTGPAGVGKTRLGEELLQAATAQPTARAVGHPATATIPLGALAHLLPPMLTDELGIGEDDRTAMFHRARNHLADRSDGERLLLLIDDVDLLDPTSLALLLPLTIERKVFLVTTIRDGRQLPSVIATLLKDGHLVVEQVPVLTADEVATLLHRVLDGPIEARTSSRLAAWSGGNLQVLRELVHRSVEQATLLTVDGVWRLTQLPTSVTLDELVAAHLANLDTEERHALELLAVAGALGLGDLETLAGPDVVTALDGRGLLRITVDGRRTRTALSHPIYGEIMRQRMSVLRSRQLQRVLADRLEAHGGRRREDSIQLALWRLEAGGDVDGQVFVNAGRLAVLGRDGVLAKRLARAARDRGRGHDAALIDVEAAALDGDIGSIERVVHLAHEDPSLPDQDRSYLARRLASARFWSGNLAQALAILAETEGVLTESGPVAAVRAHRALLLANNGRPHEALEIIAQIGDVDDPRVRVDVEIARSVGSLSIGRFGAAIHAARDGARSQAELPAWQARRGMASHLLNEAHALLYSGHFAVARSLLDAALVGARSAGARAAIVWFEVALGETERDSGHGREAVTHFTAAAQLAEAAGQSAALVWALVGIAQGHLLLGERRPAAEALAQADAHASPLATSSSTRDRARAWLMACDGDLVSARRLIVRIAGLARHDGMANFECGVVHDLVRFGDPSAAVERLGALESIVEGPYVRALAAHARAAVAGDVAMYRDAIDQFLSMGCLVLGAEAATELAALHRRAARQREATAVRRQAHTLVEAAGGARTPGLLLGDGIEPLSAREREVALLAAAGVASKDIAERLFLSKRTVDSHLSRVYRKLGVTGRDELDSAVGPARPQAGS